MKRIAIVAAIAVVVLVLYRLVLPHAFVSAGRGSLTEERLKVERVAIESTAVGQDGHRVAADTDKKFVVLDVHLALAPNQVDPDDFQLVKSKAEKLGTEENVGSNLGDNSFFWTPLGGNGQPVDPLDSRASDTRLRLSFQVPKEARVGYLFYWGVYRGPIDLVD